VADNPLSFGTNYSDPDNPLTQGTPTWADAYNWHAQNLADTATAMRNPQTWVDAARQYGNALLMGTTTPGEPLKLSLDKLQLPGHLTDAERQAVSHYASSSPWVNGPAPEAEPVRKSLDTAIEKSELGENATLYRGFGASPDIVDQLQVGNVVPLSSGHVSTTLSKDTAQVFADDLYSRDETSVVVKIQAPSGTKALAVPTAPELERDPDNPVSQKELLLPRGTQFKITGRRETGGGRLEITATPATQGDEQ
jgi:hypothetical protein